MDHEHTKKKDHSIRDLSKTGVWTRILWTTSQQANRYSMPLNHTKTVVISCRDELSLELGLIIPNKGNNLVWSLKEKMTGGWHVFALLWFKNPNKITGSKIDKKCKTCLSGNLNFQILKLNLLSYFVKKRRKK